MWKEMMCGTARPTQSLDFAEAAKDASAWGPTEKTCGVSNWVWLSAIAALGIAGGVYYLRADLKRYITMSRM